MALRATFALGAAAVLGLSAWFKPDALPKVELCTFHRLTGLPCPGCGLTRAFCCITHGEWTAAWQFNPFGYLFYAGCLILIAWPLVNHFRPTLEPRLTQSRWFVRGPLLLLGLMWLFGMARIIVALLGGART
ncbi:MAG: hypothetical protein A3K19_31830 [Lentisphaerae bacterium RIFOXYB12_FULL_65_16]|nr:MAG: hypothetical protein A3K18_10610 [Lentisphaerae bacterium RIFOXYA12_64_32]OGV88773.1 MAG: hypothetical protein A3K19_31830 [Lentisphaerae bacterium RIFOXYB12_FULL_65_16]